MNHVFLFSFTAMLNPTLLAATTVLLLLPDPKKLMLGYLLGAMLVSITLGLVIVFTLENSGAVSTAKNTVNPAVDLALGGLLILISIVLATGRPQERRARRRELKGPKKEKGTPRWQQALAKGSPRVTFVVGMLLTLPGASYLAALHGISGLDYSTVATVLLVLMVNIIMLTLIELPLIGYFIAPDWTAAAIQRAKGWFPSHAHKIAVIGTAAIGSLLILRGLITLLT